MLARFAAAHGCSRLPPTAREAPRLLAAAQSRLLGAALERDSSRPPALLTPASDGSRMLAMARGSSRRLPTARDCSRATRGCSRLLRTVRDDTRLFATARLLGCSAARDCSRVLATARICSRRHCYHVCIAIGPHRLADRPRLLSAARDCSRNSRPLLTARVCPQLRATALRLDGPRMLALLATARVCS